MFLLMSGTNNFAKNIFLPHFEIVKKISLFCKVRACQFSVKNSIFQKLPQILKKCFFWWVERIILPKNNFLPHFEIVPNLHYFVRVAPFHFPSKIQFSKNCLKRCRNVSFDEWNNNFAKKYFLTSFWDSKNFHYFVRSAPVDFRSKIQLSKNCLKYCRKVSFDEWNK